MKYSRSKLIIGTAFLSAGVAIRNYALMGAGGAWIALSIISKLKEQKEKKENHSNIRKYYIVSKRKIVKK